MSCLALSERIPASVWCPVALEYSSVWCVLVVFYAYVLMSICMSLYIPGLRCVHSFIHSFSSILLHM